MRKFNDGEGIRDAARAFERALPAARRKRLGQFFTGVPLGKVLAALALSKETRTVLDPMAGHGDLLDAVNEIAAARHVALERLDGVEIDEDTADRCRKRLAALLAGEKRPARTILTGSAFEPSQINALSDSAHDLVITNPPYVRYQERSGNDGDPVRSGLLSIIDDAPQESSRHVWRTLADGYSGLADLSVPAWLLAGHLVRPGGRIAIVAPATWRSRNYADTIRYLLLRCFEIELIVEDTQPGWFSDALVRTHLIVARRLERDEAATPLSGRKSFASAKRLRIAPDAASEDSLVGSAFVGNHPEIEFAAWAHDNDGSTPHGIEIKPFDLREEWLALLVRIKRQRWYDKVESTDGDLPLFARSRESVSVALPEPLRESLPARTKSDNLVSLEEAGIAAGQGLRTGCNQFFYIDAIGPGKTGTVTIELSAMFAGARIQAPVHALRPVLRRQTELEYLHRGELPPGRVLDLRSWILPEDAQDDIRSSDNRRRCRVMPGELAEFVRNAATKSMDGSGKRIPELSAVRTNVRKSGKAKAVPRHWYMLPDFAPRHLPLAFAPRVNNGTPWVECNTDSPLLIDANFSTFWSPGKSWTRHALKALLNSVWCRAFMETLGTPMGGGALKLEATHLRQMSIPRLGDDAKRILDEAGKTLTGDNGPAQDRIDHIVLRAIVPDATDDSAVPLLARDMKARTELMRGARRRTAS